MFIFTHVNMCVHMHLHDMWVLEVIFLMLKLIVIELNPKVPGLVHEYISFGRGCHVPLSSDVRSYVRL